MKCWYWFYVGELLWRWCDFVCRRPLILVLCWWVVVTLVWLCMQETCTQKQQKERRLLWKVALPASITHLLMRLGHKGPTDDWLWLAGRLQPAQLHWPSAHGGIIDNSYQPTRNVRFLFTILHWLLHVAVCVVANWPRSVYRWCFIISQTQLHILLLTHLPCNKAAVFLLYFILCFWLSLCR